MHIWKLTSARIVVIVFTQYCPQFVWCASYRDFNEGTGLALQNFASNENKILGSEICPNHQDTASMESLCQELGCLCGNKAVDCTFVEPNRLDQRLLNFVVDAHSISFTRCHQKYLDLYIFSNFTSLRSITIRDCGVQRLLPRIPDSLQTLLNLTLSENELWDWNELCEIFNKMSSLKRVDLSHNRFTDLSHTGQCMVSRLHYLNLSYNKVSQLLSIPNAVLLDLSSNELTEIVAEWPVVLSDLNLSNNPFLERLPSFSLAPQLNHLKIDNCRLSTLPLSTSLKLRRLSVQRNKLTAIDFTSLHLPSLQELDLSNNSQLHSIMGVLPATVRDFRLKNTQLRYFPSNFFLRAKNLNFVDLMPNNWSCDSCLLRWIEMLPSALRPQLNCSNLYYKDCSIGISERVEQGMKYIIRARYGEAAVLPCDAYGDPPLFIEWWLVKPLILIGSYNVENKIIAMNWTRSGVYDILIGGSLLITNAMKEVVERYRCVASNMNGNASQIVHFRLDYSSWYHLAMTESVFWGSILAAVITCGITFALNLLWIICRQAGLWWINRLERNSRVREMVAALERYRLRQMAVLSETYHKRLEQVRENYHQQVEQLRTSYTLQFERFRDYRVAQMESMNQHLENMRENYNQQMGKLRDYGSRRVEQLWEGYERQMNRLRMFSLQQRLGLMRKYKVKQQYLNKLVEKFADNPSQTFIKPHPEVILTEPVPDLNIPIHRRFGSFHSLPEYLLHDECMPSNVQSEFFQESCSRNPYILVASDSTVEDGANSDHFDDPPCSSRQNEVRRDSVTLELSTFRPRPMLSFMERRRRNATASYVYNENEPLHNENTSSN